MKKLKLEDVCIRANISPQTTELSVALTERGISRLNFVAPMKWIGKIRGPICSLSQTLAANYALSGDASGKSARAVIPDFCHWTSELPFTYELEFQLHCGDSLVANLRERIAVTWIALHRGKLYRSGKRWIPRMARISMPASSDKRLEDWLEEIRANELVLVARASDASDGLLSACQHLGVSLVIEMAPTFADSITRYESLGCVLMLLQSDPRQIRIDTSLLVAMPCDPATGETQRWQIGAERAMARALIAAKPGNYQAPADARRACDELQASIAAEQDWAGYLV